jgi:hypothetical protein
MRPWRVFLATAVALTGLTTVGSAERPSSESAIKASFVFNVASFVEWPASAFASPTSPLRVALVSPHPLPDFADALHGKSIRGRSVVVDAYEDVERVGESHVIFLTAEAAAQLRTMVRRVEGQPVLTIAEQDIQSPCPAVISVGIAQTKLAFAVNLDSADAAGLQMSPNLLKLAKNVQSRRARTK